MNGTTARAAITAAARRHLVLMALRNEAIPAIDHILSYQASAPPRLPNQRNVNGNVTATLRAVAIAIGMKKP